MRILEMNYQLLVILKWQTMVTLLQEIDLGVYNKTKNFRNELTITSDSQIANYGDPITRNRSRRL